MRIAAVLAGALSCATLNAATLHVTSQYDTHQDGALTLREAIAQSSAGDTIVIDVTYAYLSQGELQVTHDLTIDGGQFMATVEANGYNPPNNLPQFRLLEVLAGNVTLSNLTMAFGTAASSTPDAPSQGGAILNNAALVLNHCAFQNDYAIGASGSSGVNAGVGGSAQGGALYNKGTAILIGCTFSSGGSASGAQGGSGGGGVMAGTGGAGEGGAIYNEGTMSIDKCYITSTGAGGGRGGAASTVATAGGTGGAGRGGGCYNKGNLTVTNSTFLSLRAVGGEGGDQAATGKAGDGGNGYGGALANDGDLTLVNVTVYQCEADGGISLGNPNMPGSYGTDGDGFGGGLAELSSGAIHMVNTLVAADRGGLSPDVYGAIDSHGHNLIGAADGSSGWQNTDQRGTASQAIELEEDFSGGDRGGPSGYILFQAGSPNIDAGDDAVLNPPYKLATDQTLFPRRIGSHVDIGAAEFDPPQAGDDLVVNSIADHGDRTCGVTDCTLRDATEVASARSDKTPVTISFAANITGTIDVHSTLLLYHPITIKGPGAAALTVRATSSLGVFETGQGCTISGLTITGTGQFGESAVVTKATNAISNCVFINNSGLNGAIDNVGTLTVTDCVFANNRGGEGGAIYNDAVSYQTDASATVSGCTFSGNSSGGDGGAIVNASIYGSHATLNISNSTMAGNSAAEYGGAIYNQGMVRGISSVTITNCTISSNTSAKGGNAVANNAVSSQGSDDGVATVTITNTISAAATGGGATLVNLDRGQITSGGSNISTDAAGGDGTTAPGGLLNASGDMRNSDPRLDPAGLKDNSGATPTLALQSGSPAIDAGDDSDAPPTDQRGLPRVGRSDIGAYEFQTPGSSATPTPAATSTPAAVSQNISTRLEVLTEDNVMIGGFIVTGTSPKKVIVRAIGPSIGIDGALADPTLELHMPDGSVVTNDNWQVDDASGQSQADDVRATGVPPSDDRESALVRTLNPGNYTAIVRGNNGGTGIGLVEVYDIGGAGSTLANISTRGFVDTADNVMIGGFIIGPPDSTASRIAVRAIGPSTGVAGALQDPVLELHDENGGMIATNDNWQDDPGAADIQSSQLAPADPRESAMIRSLNPGKYTAVVRGANATTGVGLVEVYNLR